MTKTELKAYLATLRGVAKKGSKTVEVADGKVYALLGYNFVVLDCGVKGRGEFGLDALTTLEISLDNDLGETELVGVAKKFVEQTKTGESVALSKATLDAIKRASEYTCKDGFRVALEDVVLRGDKVIATDGYRAYLGEGVGIETRLNPVIVEALKRVAKYGEWSISASEEQVMLTNGIITLIGSVRKDGFPDMEKVVGEWAKNGFDKVVVLPARDALKYGKDTVKVGEDNSITVDGVATPLNARFAEIEPFEELNGEVEVILPRVEEEGVKLGLTAKHLKPLVDKDGFARLYWAKDNRLLVRVH